MLLLGTVFWPWAGGGAADAAVSGAARRRQLSRGTGVVLFDGHEYTGPNAPLVLCPVVVPDFDAARRPCRARRCRCCSCRSRDGRAGAESALWAVVVLPDRCRDRHALDALRRRPALLFIYPVLVVLAAAGWTGLRSPGPSAVRRDEAQRWLAAGVASMLVFDVRFHPNQGVYFNALVGGPRGAFARYDMDYWGNCVLQAR